MGDDYDPFELTNATLRVAHKASLYVRSLEADGN